MHSEPSSYYKYWTIKRLCHITRMHTQLTHTHKHTHYQHVRNAYVTLRGALRNSRISTLSLYIYKLCPSHIKPLNSSFLNNHLSQLRYYTQITTFLVSISGPVSPHQIPFREPVFALIFLLNMHRIKWAQKDKQTVQLPRWCCAWILPTFQGEGC